MNIPTQLSNPGDLRPTDSSQQTQETPSGTFRQFDNPGKGFEALLNDLQSKISGTSKTGLGPQSNLVDFSEVYAPESDNNNSGQYAANLANHLKVSPATTLGELQPRIGDLAQAVASNEGYQWADQPATTPPPQTPSAWDKFMESLSPSAVMKTIGENPSAIGAAGLVGGATAIPSFLSWLGLGGGIAAGTEATNPGLLSKTFNFGKTLAGDIGIGDVANKVLGIGGQPQQAPQPQEQQSQQNQNQNILSQMAPQINASKGAYNAYQENLQQTMSGRNFLQDPYNREAVLNASISGRLPDTANGFNDFTQAEKERQAEASATAKMERVVVGEGKASTEEAVKIASQHLPNNMTPKERDAAIRHIKSEAASYGKTMELGNMVQARHQQYASTKGSYNMMKKSTAQITAHKALAKGFRETIKNHTLHKELYEKLLKHQQNLKNEQKLYKILSNKKPPATNKFTKSIHKFGTRLFATYVGDKVGGVLGAVLGNLVLNLGQKSADKRFGANIFESPQVRAGLKVMREGMPNQYQMFKAELMKKGIQFPKEETEGALIKEMKKGGVTKKEGILTEALKKPVKELRKKKR